MRLTYFHRLNAIILGVFIVSHLSVHLFALGGPDLHRAALQIVQPIYRNAVGETLLVFSIVSQIISGTRRLRFRHEDTWARLQVASGLYLMMFLTLHTGAALYTHHIFGLETDFYWAAGSLHFDPIRAGFAIYCFLAVAAFFTHLAAALYFSRPNTSPTVLTSLPSIGAVLGLLIVLAFSGAFYTIIIKNDVAAYYKANFGFLGVGGDNGQE